MHLDRLIAILEVVAIAGRGLTAVEVQKVTGLPRPTCYRLLQTRAKHRLIDDLGGSSHCIAGERLIRIALLGKSDIDVHRACAPALKVAATTFGDIVFLARFRSRQVEIIHVETPDDPSGALGAYTKYTKSTKACREAEFEQIAKQGHAECHQDIDIGVSSVAAPVLIGHIGASFSVGVVDPVSRFKAAYRNELGEELIQIAERRSAAIQLSNEAQIEEADIPLLKPVRQQEGQSRRQH